ncbi:hypothetical protein ACIQU5_36155 [Streptomyces sp. NPDC090306]
MTVNSATDTPGTTGPGRLTIVSEVTDGILVLAVAGELDYDTNP